MGGKEEEDNYKCTTTRTDWLTDCHRQLLKANLLVLTELAASEGRDGKAEGDVMRGAALLRDVRWFPPDCTREPSVHSLTASLHCARCSILLSSACLWAAFDFIGPMIYSVMYSSLAVCRPISYFPL